MSKLSKSRKRALKEAAKRGRRIWREVSEQAGIPKRRKAVKESTSKRTAVTENAAPAPSPVKPLHQLNDAEWQQATAAYWGQQVAAQGGVPDFWKTGPLSANLTQQPPAA